jgi:hypothetical protein
MRLQLLHQTPCLTVHYDACNDWLFLDWEGELTLPLVQEACVALGSCVLVRPYPRVLNSNEQVTGVSWSIAPWLITDLLPHLALAGVERVAWVYSSSVRGQHMVQTILGWLPGSRLEAFGDTAEAVAWLQRFPPTQPGLIPTRSAATQAKLAQQVQAMRQRAEGKQRQPV